MTYEQLGRQLALFADEGNAEQDDALLTESTLTACLRYFQAHADHLTQVLTLTTTPSGQIHARVAPQGQDIVDLYF